MHKIAIIHDPSSRHAHTWKQWLESANYKIDTIHDDDTFNHSKDIPYDLIIPLITIRDYTDKDNARMKALSYFESKDLHLLTPSGAIAVSSDKLKTAAILSSLSLRHPWTSLAEEYTWIGKRQTPLVMKPRFGHSGHEIRLIQNENEFNKYKRGDMLVQSFIKSAVCIRVITGRSEVLSAYKKIPPVGEFIANIDRGAVRQPIVPTKTMSELAKSTVQALGGGLMGVDLLDSPEGLFVLESNVPFGFDVNDRNLEQKLIAYIQKEIQ